MKTKQRLALLALGGLSLLFSLHSAGATRAMPVSQLEAYIDGVMQQALVEQNTVGATVALVQDGRLAVARGYGFADLAEAVPVEARRTGFRIGSITKVLTWMAVLQQVEAGRLDLDADVNEYLRRFKIPTAFAEPVTLRHLMTHTAGFEDNAMNLFAGGPRQLQALALTLGEQMPERLYAPGRMTAYSNYGTALAGLLVANVSGQSWHEYVESQLLKPMGMVGTSTRQPLPPELESRRAQGYLQTGRGFAHQPFSYVALEPAGSGTTTALDMARLMVELLNPQGTGVLGAESKALLREGAYIADPAVNGMTLGMYQMSTGPARAVGHDGSVWDFNARMVLWPDDNIGLFVAVNTDSGGALVRRLSASLSARLGFDRPSTPALLAQDSPPEAELNPLADGQAYVGEYHTARRNESNLTRLLVWLDRLQIRYLRELEQLEVQDALGVTRYRQIEPRVFEQIGGTGRLAFATAGSGDVVYRSELPFAAYTRAAPEDSFGFNRWVLLAWVLAAVSVLVYWPVGWFNDKRAAPGSIWLSALVYASIALMLVFAVRIATAADSSMDFVLRGFAAIEQMLWMPLLFSVLVLLQVVGLYRVWVRGLWWRARRVHFTLILPVQCLLVWWCWHWQLLPPAVQSALNW
ncbi:MAG: serine hydrolase domain-containing protein [Pseudomonadota bacterium]